MERITLHMTRGTYLLIRGSFLVRRRGGRRTKRNDKSQPCEEVTPTGVHNGGCKKLGRIYVCCSSHCYLHSRMSWTGLYLSFDVAALPNRCFLHIRPGHSFLSEGPQQHLVRGALTASLFFCLSRITASLGNTTHRALIGKLKTLERRSFT